MNQKTFKLQISILTLFLISFEIGILSNILQSNTPIIDLRNDEINPITSSSGWGSEIMEYLGDFTDGLDLFVGDADNDGYNDIVVANFGSNDISILIWNPSLEDWKSPIIKSLGGHGRSITVGDANNDGDNDIVVGWYSGTSPRISVYCWNSSLQNWNTRITKSVDAQPGNTHVGDVNNDGYYDILTGGYYGTQFSCFFWNDTINDWNPQTIKNLASLAYDVFLGDANNDGFNDVVATLHDIDDINILIWNDTLTNWNPGIVKSVGDYPSHIFIDDANNDGYNDIAVTNRYSNDISIFIWNNSISNWNGEIRKTVGDNPWGLFVRDANSDGFKDIVVAIDNKYISLYLWNSTLHSWNTELQLGISFDPIEVFVDDVNNDGLNDIASVGLASFVSILLSYIDTPVLNLILPSVDTDGIVKLNWSKVYGITHYYIYRNTSYIDSIDGLDPIDTISDNNYTDIVSMNVYYYYVVVASDGFGNSSISNCRSVEVRIPLDTPQLDPITPNPDIDGSIYLDWNDVDRATIYFIFRDTSFITSTALLTPIATISESFYTETLYQNGIYFYVIIASNGVLNSSISNCNTVTIGWPLYTPNLFHINNYRDGTVELFWDEVENATIYYVYQDNVTITSIDHLNPIAIVPAIYESYFDPIYNTGEYFYVVVASDSFGNSSISNCMSVYVEYITDEPIEPGIPGYNVYFIILTISILCIVFFFRKYKNML